MKLVNAKIFNFRLLDGIEMKFATDPEKNLTVIRAANESGKTTLLMALQWGLFGDEALPSNYVLRPMDAEQGKAIETKVQIEYEIEPAWPSALPSRTLGGFRTNGSPS